jgi:hypothetical protein
MVRLGLDTMALAPRSSTACLIALFLAVSAAAACSKSKTAPASSAKVLGRYWLTNTELRSDGAGGKGFTVTAPTLVELLPNGLVRSIPNTQPKFEGLLPPEVLQEPQTGRGLMLYAQRVGDIHWRSPEGLLYGRLHPGAFVSVIPTDRMVVRIGNLPFGHEPGPFVLYVDRDLLGTQPREPAPIKAPEDTRAVRWPFGVMGWIADPDKVNIQVAWTAVRCEDVWVSRDLTRVSQYIRGVEAIGIADGITARRPTIQLHDYPCPAHFIARRGSELIWTETDNPEKPAQPRVLLRIPDGFKAFAPAPDDPLGHAIDQGASLYWLLDDGTGPKCDEWSFRLKRPRQSAAEHPGREGRLVRRAKWEGETAWYPMSFLPSEGDRPAVLHLGTIMLSGGGTLKCECVSDYSLLRADNDELEVIARSLPEGLVAYDPAEAERWFLSPAKCEAARTEAERALQRDGSIAPRLGIHAAIAAFGI